MRIDAERVTAILVDALHRRHGDDVDLVFRYGSLLRGTSHAFSDLDISWVPRRADTWDAITVLVGDTLVDCYPIHWTTLEQMAEMGNVSCSILRDGLVVDQRSDEIGHRFAALGERLEAVQQPAERRTMVGRALARFRDVGYPHYLLQRAARDDHMLGALQQAEAIRAVVLHCLMLVNQAPVDTRRRAEVLALGRQPEGLARLLGELEAARDPLGLRAAADDLLEATRALLLSEQASLARETSFAAVFRSAYPELKGDLQHLLLACDRGTLTPLALVSIHHELMIHASQALTGVELTAFHGIPEYELDLAGLGFPDLLAPALAGDTVVLRRRVLAFDERLRAYLVERGVDLCEFDSPASLAAALDGRDAVLAGDKARC